MTGEGGEKETLETGCPFLHFREEGKRRTSIMVGEHSTTEGKEKLACLVGGGEDRAIKTPDHFPPGEEKGRFSESISQQQRY